MLWRGEIISVRSEMKLPSRQVNLWSHAFELQMFYWHDETTGRVTAFASLQWRRNGCDGVSNHQPYDCLLNRLFRRRSKKTSKLCVSGLCAGNSPVTGEFTAQMASDAENVSIWWRHHVLALSHRDRINHHWIISTFLSISIPFSGSVMATFLPQKRTHATIHPKNYAHGSHFVHDDVIKWKHFPRYWPFVSPATGEFPAQRPVTRSFDIFFDLRPNKRLIKQSWGWWFEMPSCSLWRRCNVIFFLFWCVCAMFNIGDVAPRHSLYDCVLGVRFSFVDASILFLY